MNKILKSAILITFVFMVSGGVASAADLPQNDDPIKLFLNDWTGQSALTKIADESLK